MFPAETAFSERMIPALAAEGIDWVLIDNIHFDRACEGYPHTNASNLFAPNKADQINPDPALAGGAWVQLNNLWAPSRVSAPFGYQPHRVQHVDPETGATTQVVAVPAARYEGNEDGRGGYGAFLYDVVMDQYLAFNTDAAHPMFVVLHHDGDNFGGGSEGYYHGNFQQMVNWASTDPDYDVSTVQDYLQRFPPAAGDVIHVEDGAWAGADNGDAEFKKWLGDPNASGWSPDQNSWAVLTAAKNRVFMAESIAPVVSMQNVLTGGGAASNTEKAWHFLLCAEASDYWYWDGTEIWDSNVTRGCNQAVIFSPPSGILAATYRAERYAATVAGQEDVLIDYYVEAVDGAGNVKKSDIQHVWVGAAGSTGGGDVVTISPSPAQAGQSVLVQYNPSGRPLAGAGSVLLHYGFNNWAQVISPDPAMSWNAGTSRWELTVNVPSTATQFDVVFNNGSGTWDNNGGADWHFAVQGAVQPVPTWTMNGVLDADATLAAQNGGLSLWYGVREGLLYVATNDAGEGNDHFIFVADAPGTLRAAPWAKAGQVANWTAFLADENNNDYEAWFDAVGATQAMTGPNGGVLEGTIDLAGEFGAAPDEVCLAVGAYANNDGGALLPGSQVPASTDGDGNIEAAEYICVPTRLKGDLNRDWRIDLSDVPMLVNVLLENDADAYRVWASDINLDGQSNSAPICRALWN
ncbi:MAG: hypothetical protein IPK83_01470 [Planctomycetes bacterium]|nr:hypothetical protein [Planctomycetota bacterium]